MRKFNYEAKDKSTGKIIKSTVQAEGEHAAAKLLIEQGYMPLDISSVDDNDSIFARITNRITGKDKILFLRQLSTLIGAGLPLAQSIRTVSEQTESKRLREIIEEILADIEGGKSLSKAFSKYPDVFDDVVVALVTAGEASGTLDKALHRIATQKEKDAALISKIRGAMVYPGIVLLVIIAVMLFMLLTIVPQVERLYADMNRDLPFLTALMINVADFLLSYWWVVLAALGIGSYFAMQYFRTEPGRRNIDLLKLNIPLFSAMFRKLYMARFARTGQTLLSTGVAMLDMLRISAKSVNNVVIAEEILHAADKVKGGKALSDALQKEEYVLVMVPQMVRIGEQSGKIDEMMGKTAQVYEDELNDEIKALTTTIEPILMVVMAVFAGGMVTAILFPIYNLVDGIR
ncbi:pilus assembly protein PilC [Candidatus Saccharibacteria bacterium]|nr:MAG: pilus assembly protein PilC [Candidatus Saccharibacteria bacterium]